MADWTLKFVDRIDAAPSVRLDLNDQANFRALADGCDFSPPQLRRSQSGTIMTDGQPVDASAFDNRVVHVKALVKANSADSLTTKLRSLMFELNRERNNIMLQRGSTPLFFRTYRTPDIQVDLSNDGLNQATVDCPIVAEPFAYGLRVDAVTAATVTNNPTAGTNPQYLDVNTVAGDVDTPAYITLPAQQTLTTVALRAGGTPPPMVFQAEAGTPALGTLPGNDAAMSGAGNNYVRFTGAGNLAGIAPPGTGTDLRGTYRVFMRYRLTVPTDSWSVGWHGQDSSVPLPVITMPQVVDLGLQTWPNGADDPRAAGFGAAVGVAPTGIRLDVNRTAGTGNLDIDYFLFIPADQAFCAVQPFGTSLATHTLVLDGPNDSSYSIVTSTGLIESTITPRVGSIPFLRPGANNRLYFPAANDNSVDSLTETQTVSVSYWPRYLVV